MVPTITSQNAAGPLRKVSPTLAQLIRDSQQSATATLELLKHSKRLLDAPSDGAADSTQEELAHQRESFEQAMQEIVQERKRITAQRQDTGKSQTNHSGATPDAEQLRTRAAGLFVTNPTASVVWHTLADQQALADILRLIYKAVPERCNSADAAYDNAVAFLRNLHASFADNPQALVLRDQLRTITNHDARERLRHVIDHYQPDSGK